ncbi:hypothetical protein JCM11251_007665 [Rhodosporidiobolus azoricus]
MPPRPRRVGRRSVGQASLDPLPSLPDTAPASTARQTRRTTRASEAAEEEGGSLTTNCSGSEASTPESNNEPTTPQDEPDEVDAGELPPPPGGRPSRKRTKTPKALEPDQSSKELRQSNDGTDSLRMIDEQQRRKRQRPMVLEICDDSDSPLTDSDEEQQPPKKKGPLVPVVELWEKVQQAAPVPVMQEARPVKGKTRLVLKPPTDDLDGEAVLKALAGQDSQPCPLLLSQPADKPSAAPPAPSTAVQSASTPTYKKASARQTGRYGAKGKGKGKKAANSGLVKPSKRDWFEVLSYGDPFATLEAYLRPPSSSHFSSRRSSQSFQIPLKPLSVIRSTSSPNSYVSYRFALPAACNGDSSSIERVVVKV